MDINLRRARPEDREKLIEVESKTMPHLQYLPNIFDMLISDEVGELSVAEMDGEVVAFGKFTLVPDGSAWLEALRVVPERQGLGIGKRFYERFFDLARLLDVTTMRIYTGIRNVVSKGLAERYGFRQVAEYRGAWIPCQPGSISTSSTSFQQVINPKRATTLLMPFRDKWGEFLAMNRNFARARALTPSLCAYLAREGMIFEEPSTRSVITLGARFLYEKTLHIGAFRGDVEVCLGFAMEKGVEQRLERLSCYFPPSASDIQDTLIQHGFARANEASDFIVMEAHVEE